MSPATGPAEAIGIAAEKEPGDDKGNAESGQAVGRAIPAMRLVIQGDEGGDHGKSHSRKRDAFITLYYQSHGWNGAAYGLTAFGVAFIVARLFFGGYPDRFGGARVALACL